MLLTAGVGGFALGDGIAAVAGWSSAIRAGFACCFLLQIALETGWRLTRTRRRSRAAGEHPA